MYFAIKLPFSLSFYRKTNKWTKTINLIWLSWVCANVKVKPAINIEFNFASFMLTVNRCLSLVCTIKSRPTSKWTVVWLDFGGTENLTENWKICRTSFKIEDNFVVAIEQMPSRDKQTEICAAFLFQSVTYILWQSSTVCNLCLGHDWHYFMNAKLNKLNVIRVAFTPFGQTQFELFYWLQT